MLGYDDGSDVVLGVSQRRQTHKSAEQKRRDYQKLSFDAVRSLLPSLDRTASKIDILRRGTAVEARVCRPSAIMRPHSRLPPPLPPRPAHAGWTLLVQTPAYEHIAILQRRVRELETLQKLPLSVPPNSPPPFLVYQLDSATPTPQSTPRQRPVGTSAAGVTPQMAPGNGGTAAGAAMADEDVFSSDGDDGGEGSAAAADAS